MIQARIPGTTLAPIFRPAHQRAFSMPTSLELLVALAKLTSREREVFVDHHVLYRTYEELAQHLGVSKARIYQIERRAQKKLRRELTAA